MHIEETFSVAKIYLKSSTRKIGHFICYKAIKKIQSQFRVSGVLFDLKFKCFVLYYKRRYMCRKLIYYIYKRKFSDSIIRFGSVGFIIGRRRSSILIDMTLLMMIVIVLILPYILCVSNLRFNDRTRMERTSRLSFEHNDFYYKSSCISKIAPLFNTNFYNRQFFRIVIVALSSILFILVNRIFNFLY